jgi:hypothetical protein
MPHTVSAMKDLAQVTLLVVLLACIGALSACGKAQNTVPNTVPTPPTLRTFASPEDAGASVFEAAKTADQTALLAIFGPDAREILFSGDAAQDQKNMREFVAAYSQMHRWRKMKAGGEVLYLGADNFLFPIPLGENSHGEWQFDTDAGKDEILARRIGKNELAAIAACSALASAQQRYFSVGHDGDAVKQYAQRILSAEGKQNGLYWPVGSDQVPSPLEDIYEFAKASGYSSSGGKPQPFNGYYFRILTGQGDKAPGGARDYVVDGKMTAGFAFLAYPAKYRDSGIMTFMVGSEGVVYQKDLGENTTGVAGTLAEFNPGDGWAPAL